MNRKILLVAMSVLALPLAANAQTASGMYISVGGGVNKMPQEDVSAGVSSATTVPGEVLTSAGPALVVGVGRGFGHGLRVEVEGDYRANNITGEAGVGGEDSGTGTERKFGVMANGLYDFNLSRIKPYVGGGIGAQFVHEPDASSVSGPVSVAVVGQTKGSFAYQAIVGAAFPIQSVRGLSITAEYRYLGLAGTRTYSGTATIPGVGSFPLTESSSNDSNHSILVGIRYGFGG